MSPLRTIAPSLKWTSMISLSMRALTATEAIGVTLPSRSTRTGTASWPGSRRRPDRALALCPWAIAQRRPGVTKYPTLRHSPPQGDAAATPISRILLFIPNVGPALGRVLAPSLDHLPPPPFLFAYFAGFYHIP